MKKIHRLSLAILLFLESFVFGEKIDSPLVGTYSAILPSPDSAGRVVTLDLLSNGEASMTTETIGKGDQVFELGKWTAEGNSASVIFTKSDGKKENNSITWTLNDHQLQSSNFDKNRYGSSGLPLNRASTGQNADANFNGVSFHFDAWLASSAQGRQVPAKPVNDGPELGGGAPEHIQFTFNNKKPSDSIDPLEPQILILPTKQLSKLDPSVAKVIEKMKEILGSRSNSSSDQIPVFPIFSAEQVFQSHKKYLRFKNGGGVRFLTYYAQEAAPIRRDRIFYTFQGGTTAGRWYISAFWPVTTTSIPEGNQNLDAAAYDAFMKQFDSYVDSVLTNLDGTAAGGYVPHLKVLDEMIQSLNVAPNLKPE